MRSLRQMQQAVVWGCLGLFSTCPFFDTHSNTVPLQFGMSVDAATAALEVPLILVKGRGGAEVYYAERPTPIPSFWTYDHYLWLQFRRGRLTGWHNDYQRVGLW